MPDALTSAVLDPPDALTSALLNPPSPMGVSVARVDCPRCEAPYPLGALASAGWALVECARCRCTFGVPCDDDPKSAAASQSASNLWTELDFDDSGDRWEVLTHAGLRYTFDDAYTLLRYLAAGRLAVEDTLRIDEGPPVPLSRMPDFADGAQAALDTFERLGFFVDPEQTDALESVVWEIHDVEPMGSVKQLRRARRLSALLATAVGAALAIFALKPAPQAPAAPDAVVAQDSAPAAAPAVAASAAPAPVVAAPAAPAPAPSPSPAPAVEAKPEAVAVAAAPVAKPSPRPLAAVPADMIPSSPPLSALTMPVVAAEAEPVAEAAPAEEPESSQAAAGRTWFEASQRARAQGRLETAREMLVRSVIRAPEAPEYWLALASVQTELGETDDAARSAALADELIAAR